MVNGLHLYSAFIQSAVQFMPLIHPFTHTFTHQRRLAAMQGTNQLVRSNQGLGVLLRDTSTRPGWDRTGNPPTARRQLYLLSHSSWHKAGRSSRFAESGVRTGSSGGTSHRHTVMVKNIATPAFCQIMHHFTQKITNDLVFTCLFILFALKNTKNPNLISFLTELQKLTRQNYCHLFKILRNNFKHVMLL